MDNQDTPDERAPEPGDHSLTAVRTARPEHRRRYLDRLTTFSDGVAAIALTLLVLPLVDIAAPQDGQSAWQALADSSNELWAFAVTFLVIAVLWMAHNRIFSFIDDYDTPLIWINNFYLFAIVALPFPSKWLQFDGFANGVGTFYFLLLCLAVSALYLMSRHARRNPELLTQEARDDPSLMDAGGAPFYPAYFALGAVVALFYPDAAGWYLLALWPLAKGVGWLTTRRNRTGTGSSAAGD